MGIFIESALFPCCIARQGRNVRNMRTIIVFLYLLIYYVFSIPMWIIGWIIGKINPDMKPRYAQTLIVGAFKVILFISGVKVTVKGKENVLKDQAAMYAFNHRSFFDILVGYTTGPMPMAFVSKDDLAHVPLITRWMKAMHCLFLDRSDIKKGMQTILEGVELLKSGHSIFIAPEGTRNHEKELLPFHQASFKLAEKSECPIVPVAMNNNDTIFENQFPWIHKAHVIVEYCEPIYMEGMSREEKKHVGETVRAIIQEKVNQNEAEL